MSPVEGILEDATSLPAKANQAPAGPSRRLLNTAARIAAAAAVRNTAEDAQVLGFTPRDFVIFGLPYKNPKTSLYVRRNGALTFTITGGTHGVPYAQDRLLVIWLATVFKVCGSPETNAIAFDSLREVSRTSTPSGPTCCFMTPSSRTTSGPTPFRLTSSLSWR